MSDSLIFLAQKRAADEGTIFLWSGGGPRSVNGQSLLFLDPVDKVVAHTWEELEAAISDGIWAGYLGYELGAVADRDRQIPAHHAPTPDAVFYRYDQVVTGSPGGVMPAASGPSLKVVRPLRQKRAYMEMVAQAKEAIFAGEIYQVCLSHEAQFAGSADPFTLFLRLANASPMPFSGFLNCGPFSVVSASPERFVCRKGDRLESRPIKGTAPRGNEVYEDTQLYNSLKESPKEQAELTMITDLMRNDLGRVSRIGSVKVAALREVEAYPGVFQAHSVVGSELLPEVGSIEVLRQLFPAGSISGCPKLRAMEIIHALEERARGVYTGAIGYFNGANFDFNVAIRTLVVYPDVLSLALGGAIVMDSDPCAEYEETLHKGRQLFAALGID